jgi:hypothetical protein
MGLKHFPLISNVLLLLRMLIGITFGGKKPEWKVKVLWLLVEGQQKMLAYFAMVIKIASIPKT